LKPKPLKSDERLAAAAGTIIIRATEL